MHSVRLSSCSLTTETSEFRISSCPGEVSAAARTSDATATRPRRGARGPPHRSSCAQDSSERARSGARKACAG
eukprot:5870829-Pyramimonas_sp.AAC.2